jgi:ABC-type proline/glycine betaine transport system substrate-binding protein
MPNRWGGRKSTEENKKQQKQQQPEKMAEHFVQQRNKKIDEWRKYHGKK